MAASAASYSMGIITLMMASMLACWRVITTLLIGWPAALAGIIFPFCSLACYHVAQLY